MDLPSCRGVGFIKIKSHCTLFDGETHHEHRLPGICFLRGNAVSIFVALYCEDGSVHSLLVDQPRIPIGRVSCLEVPAGMLDDESETVAGIAVKEMEEECGIKIKPSHLVDLTELAFDDAFKAGRIPMMAVAPSPGGCDEFCRLMYLEKKATKQELEDMKGRLSGLREHGEFITLSVVPMDQVWRVSADAKAMMSLFLIEQLRRDGKLPAPGELATSLTESEAILHLPCGTPIPQLAFGLYKVPDTKEGEEAIVQAIEAGYRHFDGASFYKNEATFGRALRSSGIARTEFFITGKVWNDAVKSGRHAVRESVETSLVDIGCDYFDLFLVHWPVPGHFCEAYHELEVLHKEGKIKSLGISNFNEKEYEELVRTGISVLPVCNQMEISPVMYRKEMVSFFQQRNILVAAYKPLQRAAAFDRPVILEIAKKHRVTPGQVMLRWGLQKRLIVASKTMHPDRMRENRDVLDFGLTSDDMMRLDALTTDRDLQEREKNDIKEKASL
jgi:diketogulonate reductase-like aldo/keto reductase/8-oxo-dGTP pyrophosphatase MutT (NUDIX family)